jgi:hypothetical protein
MKKIDKTLLFLILTLAISFSLVAIFHFSGGVLQSTPGLILGLFICSSRQFLS